MKTRKKLIHEGDFVVEVEVELIEDESEWSPFLSLMDARKLDEARVALRAGDTETASRFGTVYTLTPVR